MIERGEGWEMHLGDCLSILPTVGEVDCIISDPPYGIGYEHGGGGSAAPGRQSLRRFEKRIQGDDKPFDPRPFLHWPCIMFGADHYCNWLPNTGTMHVWDKAHSGGPDDSFSDAELFWTSWRCSRQVIRHLWKGVCRDSENTLRKVHPNQKPLVVMKQVVGMAKGRVVCYPFAGSGTTGVAALQLGRKFIGIEIDPAYFAIAVNRLRQAEAEVRNSLPFAEPEPAPEQKELYA